MIAIISPSIAYNQAREIKRSTCQPQLLSIDSVTHPPDKHPRPVPTPRIEQVPVNTAPDRGRRPAQKDRQIQTFFKRSDRNARDTDNTRHSYRYSAQIVAYNWDMIGIFFPLKPNIFFLFEISVFKKRDCSDIKVARITWGGSVLGAGFGPVSSLKTQSFPFQSSYLKAKTQY